MRRLALRAAAVIAASLVLAGCASTEEAPTEPQGPNGYTASATFSDGWIMWWDRSDESGKTDLILTDAQGRMVASCLGDEAVYCVAGPRESFGVLVIAPEGAERATMQWFGEEVELTMGETEVDEAPPVFGGVMPPPADEAAGYHLDVFDGAGEVVFSS